MEKMQQVITIISMCISNISISNFIKQTLLNKKMTVRYIYYCDDNCASPISSINKPSRQKN